MRALLFEVEGIPYALPLEGVREVVRAVAVAQLPGAPPAVLGVVDLRGTLVPVVDLRARFGLPARGLSPAEHFVVADAGGRTAMVRADEVLGVVDVPDERVEDPAAVAAGTAYVAGIARLDGGLALIADLGAFLSAAEREALSASLSGGSGG